MNKHYTYQNVLKTIQDYVEKNYGTSELEDPCYNLEDMASEIANNMKLYVSEMDGQDMAKGYHSLKEWASFGFNKVAFNGHEYWDGNNFDGTPISEEQDSECGLLEMDYWDTDEDGYKYIALKETKNE